MNITSLYIIGCGDVGSRVAIRAAEEHVKVCAVSRGGKFPHNTSIPGVEFKVADLDDPDSLSGLNLQGSHLLYTAPPPGGGVTDTRARNFLAALKPGSQPVKIVYVSTTGVYGDCADETVTEERPVNPANHTAKRRWDAEEAYRVWGEEKGVPVVILRVSGIYGPGRVPLQRITAREPLLNEKEAGYTNRIHADDLAEVCLKALETGEAGEIFNVCDGEVSKMTDYFNAITDLMDLPRLPQVSLAEARKVMSPLMLTYMTESRKISNQKMLDKLGIKLKYPTLQEGLKASL